MSRAVEPLASGARIGIRIRGGDGPGMNAALRAAVRVAAKLGFETVGIRRGYAGLLDGDAAPLTLAEVSGIVRLGGTILGTSRSPEFQTEEGQERARRQIGTLGLEGMIVIGGNGSLAGAHRLASFPAASGASLRVIGIPASIDNDIGCTSLSIGVDTALNTIVDACDRILDTAAAHQRIFVVEVMGRDCGYLAMTGAIAAGAHGLLYPERGRSEEELLANVEAIVREVYGKPGGSRRALIVKSEGVKLPADRLRQKLEERIAKDFPAAEVRVTVLGHMVRGGSPSAQDRLIATRLGNVALHSVVEGRSDEMVAWRPPPLGPPPAFLSPLDPSIALFPLEAVLEETRRLKDGTSELSRWRVKVLSEIEGILAF